MPEEPVDESITTVFVNGINDKVSEYDLQNIFKSFGRVEALKIRNNIAFVKLENRASVRAAIQELHRHFEINVRKNWLTIGSKFENILGKIKLKNEIRRKEDHQEM